MPDTDRHPPGTRFRRTSRNAWREGISGVALTLLDDSEIRLIERMTHGQQEWYLAAILAGFRIREKQPSPEMAPAYRYGY